MAKTKHVIGLNVLKRQNLPVPSIWGSEPYLNTCFFKKLVYKKRELGQSKIKKL